MAYTIVREEPAKYTVTKSRRAKVKFGSSIEVDAYLLPDGEFRFGNASASTSVGYAENYLGRLPEKAPNQYKALQGEGFTGLHKIVELPSIDGGGTSAKTISLADYRRLIVFAAKKGKPEAQALLNAILEVSLEDFTRQAFGIAQLTPIEKQERIDSIICTYYLEEQEEIDDRRLPGDDLYFEMGIN